MGTSATILDSRTTKDCAGAKNMVCINKLSVSRNLTEDFSSVTSQKKYTKKKCFVDCLNIY